ncbi:hypothetical protein [Epibacterium ulvae]|uniref:hypothetical protein n=1 Tax=Epibacterium ulvae TaxID=1156985 RepID=UPI002491A9D2|nr:hypothetical protein [Epibacterium ulvae]
MSRGPFSGLLFTLSWLVGLCRKNFASQWLSLPYLATAAPHRGAARPKAWPGAALWPCTDQGAGEPPVLGASDAQRPAFIAKTGRWWWLLESALQNFDICGFDVF